MLVGVAHGGLSAIDNVQADDNSQIKTTNHHAWQFLSPAIWSFLLVTASMTD